MPSFPRVHRRFDNCGGITVSQRAMDMARRKPQALSEPGEATRPVEKRVGLIKPASGCSIVCGDASAPSERCFSWSLYRDLHYMVMQEALLRSPRRKGHRARPLCQELVGLVA